MSAVLNETNSRVSYSLPMNADLYQRRPVRRNREDRLEWTDCSRKEATDYFEKMPGFEYRALAVMKMAETLYANGVVAVEKPAALTGQDAGIVAWADRYMKRQYESDEGHGFFFASTVAKAFGIDKKAARVALDALAESGHLRTVDFANGKGWRSINLLPFEVAAQPQEPV